MNFKLEIGDGIFYSIISLIVIGLFWLRYIEKYLSLWWMLLIWGLLFIFIIYAVTNKYKKLKTK